MYKVDAVTALDFYKTGHINQYPKGTEVVYSNWTARSGKYSNTNTDAVVFFGLQAFIKSFLIDCWNETFFNRDKEEVLNEYQELMDSCLGPNVVTVDHLADLHDYGRLPILIKALPEGSLVPYGVPMITIKNTVPRFFWLTNYLESVMSTELWRPTTSATTAYAYRKRFNEHAEITGSSRDFIPWQGHDFSFRGMGGISDAAVSGAGHLLSFTGTDTVPAIRFVKDYYNTDYREELVGGSVPACYDDKTEVLTNSGFKLFKDLLNDDLVAQYEYCNGEGLVSFVKPLEYYEDKYSGKMIEFKGGKHKYADILVTPNHKMVRHNKDGVELFEAGDFSYNNRSGYSWRRGLVVSGKSKEKGTEFCEMDMLRVAFQADGSFPSHKDDYTGSRNGTKPIRFSLKREDKKTRINEILSRLKVEYNTSLTRSRPGYVDYWIPMKETFVKDFSWIDLSKVNCDWANRFLDEVSRWDGSIYSETLIKYCSTNKKCVDMVHAIASIAGAKAQYSLYIDKRKNRKDMHSLSIMLDKERISGATVNRATVDYNGYVYCVSVPSKMLIVRRNNVVAICGNTEHSVMSMGSFDGEFETFKRLITETYPTGIISIVADTWDFWKVLMDYLPRLKDEIMARDGRVVIRPDSSPKTPVEIICGDPRGRTKIERIGAYRHLWDVFGGHTNDKGYKVLDSHIGLIYGDAITLDRQDEILALLEGPDIMMTAENLVLGIGSYTYVYCTRDTHGFAMKATWGKVNGVGTPIFKDPVTDPGFKKSAIGLLRVLGGPDGKLRLHDMVSEDEETTGLLRPVFEDGELLVDDTFTEIRERLGTF